MNVKMLLVFVSMILIAGVAFGDQNYTAYKDLIFPQVAAGGMAPNPNYETWITVANRGTAGYIGSLSLYKESATAWTPFVNGVRATGGRVDITVEAGKVATYKITAPSITEVGFAVITGRNPTSFTDYLEGNLTSYIDSTVDSVGIPPSKPFLISSLPFEDFSAICLAFANTNIDRFPATVQLKLYSSTGTLQDTKSLSLLPFEHRPRYLSEIFNSTSSSFGRGRWKSHRMSLSPARRLRRPRKASFPPCPSAHRRMRTR